MRKLTRKLLSRRTTEEDTHMADRSPYPGTPRWVKVFGIIALVLVLLIVIALVTGLGGPHGPGRHSPSGGSGIEPVPILTYSSGGLGDHTSPIEHGGQQP
jgi:hypothetical protein